MSACQCGVCTKRGELGIDWRDYIDSHVHGTVETERRAERITREQHIACEVYLNGENTNDRHRLWEERTRLRNTAFRDRLREARAIGLFDEYVVQRQKRGVPEEHHTDAAVEGKAHDANVTSLKSEDGGDDALMGMGK